MNIDDLTLGQINKLQKLFDGKPMDEDGRYVIVRSRDAGVFAGNMIEKLGDEVVLHNARRIWQWSGAATLSQLAMEGTKNPDGCKFPMPVERIRILGVCEIINCSDEAEKSIKKVPVWSK